MCKEPSSSKTAKAAAAPMSASPASSSFNYAKWGDAAYLLCLVNTIAFCGTVLMFKNNKNSDKSIGNTLFDPVWQSDGFCVSNPTTPFWTSHDFCLYADVLLAAVCGIVYYFLHKQPGMESANDLVFFNLFGIVAHGMGHGGIAAALRDDEIRAQAELDQDLSYLATVLANDTTTTTTTTTTISAQDILKEVFLSERIGFMVFYIFLLKAAMRHTSWAGVMCVSILAYLGNLAVTPSFAFTYVQTVLLVAFCWNQLNRPVQEKGFAHFWYALWVSLPLGMIGWLESTMCSSFVIHLGGHLVYDAYIPISMLGFYLTCYYHYQRESSSAFNDSALLEEEKKKNA